MAIPLAAFCTADNWWASISLSFADAFRGSERTLAVNDERVQVRIPPGVKHGSRLRLKGKGNLQPGTGRRGDLYLNLKLQDHPVWRLDGDQLRARAFSDGLCHT